MTPNTEVFRDPYADIPEDDKSRFMSMVPKEDYDFLRSVRPTSRPYQGTIQTVANYFFRWLIHELKQRNITSFSKSRELELLVMEKFAIDGRTVRVSPVKLGDKDNLQCDGPVDDSKTSSQNPTASNRRTNSKGAK